MGAIIGIRREDKNKWERRVPLVPTDTSDLQTKRGLRVLVQPSSVRVYTDDEYRSAGVEVNEDLGPASIILAIKEIPTHLLLPGKTYVIFAHVVKGQPHNMPMLRRLMELGCSLVDYEKITDDQKRGVGIGEAVCAPTATSWIGDLVPPARRARAMAGFMMAAPVGVMLSFAITGPAAQAYGWRAALALGALPAVVLIPALLRLEGAAARRGGRHSRKRRRERCRERGRERC